MVLLFSEVVEQILGNQAIEIPPCKVLILQSGMNFFFYRLDQSKHIQLLREDYVFILEYKLPGVFFQSSHGGLIA
jgi:hypothetical protein